MIGRAALSAPWIFRDTWSFLTTGQAPPEPTLGEKCDLMRMHFGNMVRLCGQRVAVLEFRKAISWYARHLHPCGALRRRLRLLDSAEAFERALDEFLAWRGKHDGGPGVAGGREDELTEVA